MKRVMKILNKTILSPSDPDWIKSVCAKNRLSRVLLGRGQSQFNSFHYSSKKRFKNYPLKQKI